MIEYRANVAVEPAELTKLYDSVGWLVYSQDEYKMTNILPKSLWYVVAYDGDKLVGLLRVVGDDCSIAYIQDILVLPDYQRQGIGRELVERALKRFEHIRQIVLMTDREPKTLAFYQSVGFQLVEEFGVGCFMYLNQTR